MWKSTSKLFPNIVHKPILIADIILQQQIRTAFVLKRRYQPMLSRKDGPPRKLRTIDYIYDFVKDTNIEKQPDIDVILTTFVSGLGNKGDKVFVRPQYAYNNLLLPGLAVYATKDNISKLKDNIKDDDDTIRHSSAHVSTTIGNLTKMVISIIMNKDSSWVLQPWHIKASFRKCGIILPEEAIKMPEKPIKGPDMNVESKVFYITVTINKQETVDVRCRIHHWSTDISDKLPYIPNFHLQPSEPLFPEDKEHIEFLDAESQKLKKTI